MQARRESRAKGTEVSKKFGKLSAPLLLLLATLVLLVSGCAGLVNASHGGGSTGVGGGSSTGTTSFQANPLSLSYGNVLVGQQQAQAITVTNTGTNSVTINAANFTSPQFVLASALPMTLGAGQSGAVSIAAAPSSAGSFTASVTLVGSGGSASSPISLTATGVSSQPLISPSSTSVSFGNVSVGLQTTANFTISNTGAGNLNITMASIQGNDFGVTGFTTPATIPPGQATTLTITFKPDTASTIGGSIAFVSNDPNTPTLTIPLSGVGMSSPQGQISATPASLAFGTLNTGSSAEQTVAITNSGNKNLRISAIATTNSDYSASGIPTPVELVPGQTETLSVLFTPSAGGSRAGNLVITSDGLNSPFNVPLGGSGSQAGLSVSPTTYAFGSVTAGQSKSQMFTVTNSGSADLTISQIGVNGTGYSVSGLKTPATVSAGKSTTFVVQFAPESAGSAGGSVSIASNAPNSPSTVALSGSGLGATATITASPLSVNFGNVSAGTSASKSVTITNSGNASVTVSSVSVNASDVTASGIATNATIGAGQSATLTLSFAPGAAENVTGTVTVATAQGTSAVVAVSGTCQQAAVTLTPGSVSFGSVVVGAESTQTVQIRNTGSATLTVSQLNVSGTGFSTSGASLPMTIAAGQTSSFGVEFNPAANGSAGGSVSIVSNAGPSPTTLAMSGTGVSPVKTVSFSAPSLNFGNVDDGTTSTQSIIVSNTGNADVTLQQIGVTGTGFSLTGANTPVLVSAGQVFTFNVNFAPTSGGAATGAVSIASDASGSPATITLAGTGLAPSSHTILLNWTASTSTVMGYNVYRSTSDGSGYVKVNTSLVPATTYTDSGLYSTTTYYYVTTAVDNNGNESAYSNQASAATP